MRKSWAHTLLVSASAVTCTLKSNPTIVQKCHALKEQDPKWSENKNHINQKSIEFLHSSPNPIKVHSTEKKYNSKCSTNFTKKKMTKQWQTPPHCRQAIARPGRWFPMTTCRPILASKGWKKMVSKLNFFRLRVSQTTKTVWKKSSVVTVIVGGATAHV